jgi:crossover junction endodeoxyribonuclease RuvC
MKKQLNSGSDSYLVLGIDPGTRITGYALIELNGNKRTPLDYGCIRPPVKASLHEKYAIIFECIEKLIQKHSPHALAVETQFMGKNAQSAIKLGMARASAILPAARIKIPIYEYAPTKVKNAVVGKGQASKQQIQGMLKMLLNLDTIPTPEDAADALGIAYCHLNHYETSSYQSYPI